MISIWSESAASPYQLIDRQRVSRLGRVDQRLPDVGMPHQAHDDFQRRPPLAKPDRKRVPQVMQAQVAGNARPLLAFLDHLPQLQPARPAIPVGEHEVAPPRRMEAREDVAGRLAQGHVALRRLRQPTEPPRRGDRPLPQVDVADLDAANRIPLPDRQDADERARLPIAREERHVWRLAPHQPLQPVGRQGRNVHRPGLGLIRLQFQKRHTVVLRRIVCKLSSLN